MDETPKLAAAAAKAADLEIDEADILQRRQSGAREKSSRVKDGPGWWLVVALVIGVAVGAWVAGRHTAPSANPAGVLMADPSDQAGQPSSGMDGVMPGHGDDAEARLAELEALLVQEPDNVDALLELGSIKFAIGDPDQARDHWLRVTQIDPEMAFAWYNLGFYYLTTDPPQTEAACAALDTVVEIDTESELARTALDHLGAVACASTSGS